MTIPFIDLDTVHRQLEPALRAAFERVLRSNRFILGPEVEAFEAQLAATSGCAAAVGLSSGTDALVLGLRALGVRPGQTVLVPAFTFVATVEAVVRCGAQPVFVDVGPALVATPETVAEALDRSPTPPRAVVAVSLFGHPIDAAAIRDATGLPVLDDAAQSYGARLGGVSTPALADLTAYSFFPTKVLGGFGDGGALVGPPETIEQARQLRQHGFGPNRTDVVAVGYNARLDSLQAALLGVKLAHVEAALEARAALAEQYAERLGEIDGVEPVPTRLSAGDRHAWNLYNVFVAEPDRVRAELASAKIGSARYYPTPIHRMSAYRTDVALPQSERAAARILALPFYPGMATDVVDVVCDALRSACASGR